ncbi:hypothetical protein CM240_1277 [Clostridium bornimense]|uniref:Inner membrane protein n=1 Tax=Clostridium bornimense TaxID=1216932 RepID=W6RUV2_9CLOT|nr:DUF1819 family protein [Clostridium bornimense]CDM68441.1 hypothetical protein CM240_1277 [Clostridium bornimense]
MEQMKYSASLTSDAFLYFELKQVLKLKKDGIADKDLRKIILEKNIFEYKSAKGGSRVISTVIKRANVLDDTLREMVLTDPINTGKIINLYTIMKTSRIFYEFMDEVIREKLEKNIGFIEKKDINIFFTEKAEQNEIVENWSETTVTKLKQVIFKILFEVGIIEDKISGKLNRLFIEPELRDYLMSQGDKKYLKAMGEYLD